MTSAIFRCIAALVFVMATVNSVMTEDPISKYLQTEEKLARDVSGRGINSEEIREEDLRKLILKKLRFRDIEEDSAPNFDDYIRTGIVRRSDDREKLSNHLVDKVAALLTGLKERGIDSPNVRMPSLRFGK